jgi:glycosyltransferase involved in cell wall biosynthesis
MVVKRAEPAERRHWDNVVGPRLTGREEIMDSVDRAEKGELFSRARATLFPIRWDEPFGLVMVESMACGTPVVASPGGAAREVVEDGVTGFLRHDVDGMVEALGAIDRIEPAACRARVAELFSAEAMVSGYERLFRQAVETAGAPGPERTGAGAR